MPSYCYYDRFIIPSLSRLVQRGTLADFMFQVSPILKCSLQAIRQTWVLRSLSGCCEKIRILIKVSFLFSALGANHSMNIFRRSRRWVSTTRSILLILAPQTFGVFASRLNLVGGFCFAEAPLQLIPVFQSDLLSLTWFNKYISHRVKMQIIIAETPNNIST
jgi:hypothetical protein